MSESEPLRRDLARLDEALWSAVTTLGGDAVAARSHQLSDRAAELRRGNRVLPPRLTDAAAASILAATAITATAASSLVNRLRATELLRDE